MSIVEVASPQLGKLLSQHQATPKSMLLWGICCLIFAAVALILYFLGAAAFINSTVIALAVLLLGVAGIMQLFRGWRELGKRVELHENGVRVITRKLDDSWLWDELMIVEAEIQKARSFGGKFVPNLTTQRTDRPTLGCRFTFHTKRQTWFKVNSTDFPTMGTDYVVSILEEACKKAGVTWQYSERTWEPEGYTTG